MTWIEVADSAIKIGLGALIAGVFGYLTHYSTHKHSSMKEKAALKRLGVERVAEVVDAFSVSVSKYLSRLRYIAVNLPKGASAIPDEALEALKDVDLGFRTCLGEMNLATSRLRLIGHSALADSLRDAVKPLVQLRNDCMNERKPVSREEVDDFSSGYRAALSTFHDALSKVYLA